jgi:DNA-binding transcriptional MerR regulator
MAKRKILEGEAHPDRRYYIGEVSKMTDVPVHVLRQWEERFSFLRPRRDRNARRYYLADDVDTIRRIKELHWDEGIKTEGVNKRLRQEKLGHGRIRSSHDLRELADSIETDIRRILDILDRE